MRPQTRRPEQHRQRCKVCGNADKFNFNVPDEVWAAVVPPEFVGRVVCLPCFDDFAREQGVEYARCLTTLYFAGDQATFEFRAVSALDRREYAGGY